MTSLSNPGEVNWRALVLLGLLLALMQPVAVAAATSAMLHAGTLAFFSDTLRIVARGGAALHLADGTTVTGATAFVDLRTDRAVVAGGAHFTRHGTTIDADAFALDQRTGTLDALDVTNGIARLDPTSLARSAAPQDAASFDFPDVDDKKAYIISRTAEIVSRTSVRFVPARFPTSVGAFPVPMYMYTYSVSSGFAATSLAGAAFDQPYGLLVTPNALTSAHFRYINGAGPAIGLQENLIGSNDGFIAASADLPLHTGMAYGLDGYQRIGELSTLNLTSSSVPGFSQGVFGMTRAFGFLLGRLNYTYNSGRYQSLLLSVRTHDAPLFDGVTFHVTVSTGLTAQPGGLLPQLPDDVQYTTLWQRGVDLFVASPLVHGPLGTTLSATVDDAVTSYSFPHHYNSLNATAQASRRLSKTLTLFLGYNALWTKDVYPLDQLVFYPPTPTLPTGLPYPGYSAYAGFATYRLANLDVQYTPNPTTLVRISYQTTDDFPQFAGYGRPPTAVSLFVQLRPFSNIGIALGRTYTFGWGGAYWLPTWTFSILP